MQLYSKRQFYMHIFNNNVKYLSLGIKKITTKGPATTNLKTDGSDTV